jgi:hypothetical protein
LRLTEDGSSLPKRKGLKRNQPYAFAQLALADSWVYDPKDGKEAHYLNVTYGVAARKQRPTLAF